MDFLEGLSKQSVILSDGEDITETVEKAVKWLAKKQFLTAKKEQNSIAEREFLKFPLCFYIHSQLC
ncbi:MAG: hypothetical protein IJ091_07000 [Oscillospiraceae bacterium]|nr:hypothetical protein [Oscillospiraceae bacterium]